MKVKHFQIVEEGDRNMIEVELIKLTPSGMSYDNGKNNIRFLDQGLVIIKYNDVGNYELITIDVKSEVNRTIEGIL